MEWAALLPCGTVTARFQDGSTALLHPSGARFVSQSRDGTRVGHLTRFVTSKHRSKVRRMFDFRNFYSDSPPLLCRELLFDSDSANCVPSRVPTTSAWWPASPAAALMAEEGCSILDDGSTCIVSIEGAARLTLAAHGKFFSVRYLAYAPSLGALPTRGSDAIKGSAGFSEESRGKRAGKGRGGEGDAHWKLDRTYSCHPSLVPPCWAHPLWLAQRVGLGTGTTTMLHASGSESRSEWEQQTQQITYDTSGSGGGAGCFSRPHRTAGNAKAGHSAFSEQQFAHTPGLCDTTLGAKEDLANRIGGNRNEAEYVQSVLPIIEGLPASAVAATGHAEGMLDPLASREGGCASVVEWTDAHLLRFIPADGSVEMTSFADDSLHVLCPQGKFISSFSVEKRGREGGVICIDGLRIPRLLLPPSLSIEIVHRALSIQAAHRRVPNTTRGWKEEAEEEGKGIRRLLDQAPQLCSKGAVQAIHAARACKAQGSAAYSAHVLVRSNTEGVGVFTAFTDGRVRAVFADRTIGELSQDGASASLILSDGQEVVVRAAAPFGVEPYVVLLQQFSSWAFKSEPQRIEVHNEQAAMQKRVEEELFKIRKFQHIARAART